MLMVNILNNSYKKKWSRFYKYMGVYPIFFYKHVVRDFLGLKVFSRIFFTEYRVLESKILHLNGRAICACWRQKQQQKPIYHRVSTRFLDLLWQVLILSSGVGAGSVFTQKLNKVLLVVWGFYFIQSMLAFGLGFKSNVKLTAKLVAKIEDNCKVYLSRFFYSKNLNNVS